LMRRGCRVGNTRALPHVSNNLMRPGALPHLADSLICVPNEESWCKQMQHAPPRELSYQVVSSLTPPCMDQLGAHPGSSLIWLFRRKRSWRFVRFPIDEGNVSSLHNSGCQNATIRFVVLNECALPSETQLLVLSTSGGGSRFIDGQTRPRYGARRREGARRPTNTRGVGCKSVTVRV
jgi:hypothetical protein